MTVTTMKLGELELVVTDEGTGDPVLMLHGFPDSARLWRHQIPRLDDAGFRVIAPDQRGFGRSDKPAEKSAYTIGETMGDAVQLLDALGLERVRNGSNATSPALSVT